MRQSLVITAAFLMLTAVGLVSLRAGPVGGPQFVQQFKIPAAEKDAPGEEEMTVRFEGGRPARVIVVGDHKPVTDLELFVYEVSEKGREGKQVAHDGGPMQGDRVGVVWYPPRAGNYRIVVRNPAPKSKDNPYCEAMMSIR